MSEKFTFFWKGPFSQWHKSPFIMYGTLYNCAEQFMMASKARLFNDQQTLQKIMEEDSAKEQQALGRQVKDFDKTKWDRVARQLVYRGNIAKFSQNPLICKKLVATEGTTLVEASPIDKIWGIGLTEDDSSAKDRSAWKGKNWLGETLTKVRDDIMTGFVGECRYCINSSICVRFDLLSKMPKGCFVEIKDCVAFKDVIE
jgi:hypothetical protein